MPLRLLQPEANGVKRWHNRKPNDHVSRVAGRNAYYYLHQHGIISTENFPAQSRESFFHHFPHVYQAGCTLDPLGNLQPSRLVLQRADVSSVT